MRNSKGFTVIELMVGSVVLLIVLVISTSFFRMQSKFGGQLVKDSGSRESINTALMLIKRDIMQAGRGLYRYTAIGVLAYSVFQHGVSRSLRELLNLHVQRRFQRLQRVYNKRQLHRSKSAGPKQCSPPGRLWNHDIQFLN